MDPIQVIKNEIQDLEIHRTECVLTVDYARPAGKADQNLYLEMIKVRDAATGYFEIDSKLQVMYILLGRMERQ